MYIHNLCFFLCDVYAYLNKLTIWIYMEINDKYTSEVLISPIMISDIEMQNWLRINIAFVWIPNKNNNGLIFVDWVYCEANVWFGKT